MKVLTQQRIYSPEYQHKKLRRLIVAAGIISIIAFLSAKIFTSKKPSQYLYTQVNASQIMKRAIVAISEYCDSTGIPIDLTIDPNRTGLVGSEFSPIATTLGNLEAKRTTTNPNFAALIVQLLEQAGVVSGDTIAIGCSASFPALLIASLAAAKAMAVFPVTIISLGSSSFGATNPDFNLLHIYQLLLEKKIITVPPAAVTLGGDQDIGRDFDTAIRKQLIEQIQASGFPFIFEADLQKNVALRMKRYEGDSSDNRISAFINIGGSYANIGTSALVLKVKPGLNRNLTLPSSAERGVLFEMADRKIPIIHLLFIKGLVMKYDLPLDPIPLPKPGALLFEKSHGNFLIKMIIIVYFLTLIGLISYGKIRLVTKNA